MKNYFLIGFVGVGVAMNGFMADFSEPRISPPVVVTETPRTGGDEFGVGFLGVLI